MCKARETREGIRRGRMTVLLAEDRLGSSLELAWADLCFPCSRAGMGDSVHVCVPSNLEPAGGAV